MLPPAVRSARLRRVTRPLVVVLAVASLLTVLPGTATAAVPPTPSNLPADIEERQPFVGQSTCDPVAKPGVRAFSSMVLNAYRSTSSLGIVRDCGAGGQSEHKEGRAWDWGVNYFDTARRADATAMLSWLTATDSRGNESAMARRLGIMYMIWNKQIWKAYDSRGWQAYTGSNPHTDHVHFSFGWNGAKQVTSYWDGTVAPIDYGPTSAPSTVTPVRSPGNLAILRTYSSTVLTEGSTGNAVVTAQRALQITADGSFGPQTATAVAEFQRSQRLTVTSEVRTIEWQRLFPPPIVPFGHLDTVRVDLQTVRVAGWTIDADTTSPLHVHLYVDGRLLTGTRADVSRPDVERTYPEFGDDVGFQADLELPEGPHEICAYAINATDSPGNNVQLGCGAVVVAHTPVGAIESPVTQPPGSPSVRLAGWVVDPNSTGPVRVDVYADGAGVQSVTADAPSAEALRAYPAYGDRHGFVSEPILAEGRHTVCSYAVNAPGTPGRHAGLGCDTVSVKHVPFGSLDHVRVVPGGVRVDGWALDHDSLDPLRAHVYVDGRLARSVTTAVPRPDVARLHPGLSEAAGYTTQLDLAEGAHTVCTYAINAAGTPGNNPGLGCRSVQVTHSPVGSLDQISTTPDPTTTPGRTTITGWALDPDVAGPVEVHAYVDGRGARAVTSDQTDRRSSGPWPTFGDQHGFRIELDLPEGSRTVCLYAINAPGTPGKHVELGCQTIQVRHTPFGSLDSVSSPGAGLLRAKGWSIDPDVVGPVRLHVYVDGSLTSTGTADLARSDIARLYPAYGAFHGFVIDVPVSRGSHRVCVYAINAAGTPGSNPGLACRTVTAG